MSNSNNNQIYRIQVKLLPSEKDLKEKLKAIADTHGIKYQCLIKSEIDKIIEERKSK